MSIELKERSPSQVTSTETPAPPPPLEATPATLPRNDSARFALSVEKPIPGGNIVEKYEERGKSNAPGVAYHHPEDIERFDKATYVGIAYQIAAVMSVDSVKETFTVVVDLSIVYAINDNDYHTYEKYREEGSVNFQKLVDEIKEPGVAPPIFEIRNAVAEPEWLSERIPMIRYMYNHRSKKWQWYVSLYAQLRVTCFEEFEMERFPFTQNSLQVHIQCKKPMGKYLLVPLNCRASMPHWWCDIKKNVEGKVISAEVKRVVARGNILKCSSTTGNWEIENHHLAFMPFSDTYPMPSGDKFSSITLTVQCKQKATFFLWATVPIVLFLPMLAGTAALVDVMTMADRQGVVLALLLTMATYKASINSWLPQKNYLTFLDWYVIIGFGVILLIGIITASFSMLNYPYLSDDEGRDLVWPACDGDDGPPCIEIVETMVVLGVVTLWFFLHIYATNWIKTSAYRDWGDILMEEVLSVKDVTEQVTKENTYVKDLKFNACPKPDFTPVDQDKAGQPGKSPQEALREELKLQVGGKSKAARLRTGAVRAAVRLSIDMSSASRMGKAAAMQMAMLGRARPESPAGAVATAGEVADL